MEYDLELDNLIRIIRNKKYKRILLQLPDGLKPKAKEIVDFIKENLKEGDSADILIWAGSCYGACDIPQGIKEAGIGLFVQWGHNMFKKTEGWR